MRALITILFALCLVCGGVRPARAQTTPTVTSFEVRFPAPVYSGPTYGKETGGCALRWTHGPTTPDQKEAAGDPAFVCRFNAFFFETLVPLPDGSVTPSWHLTLASNGNSVFGHRSLMPGSYTPKNRLEIDAPAAGVYIGPTDEGTPVPTVPPYGLRTQGPTQVGGLEFMTPLAANAYNGTVIWIPVKVTLTDGSVIAAWLYASR